MLTVSRVVPIWLVLNLSDLIETILPLGLYHEPNQQRIGFSMIDLLLVLMDQ